LKAALDRAGFAGGAVRAPLVRPSEAACEEIAALLRAATEVALALPTVTA
jgi:dihydrodipicolinate synthase/N-acetylneuraminate lyase